MKKPTLGRAELKLLSWVAQEAPVSVAEAAERYGQANGLARTTLLTVLERLRQKGYLTRSKQDGVFRYRPSEPHARQLRGIVGNFMEQALGGSLEPLVAYLTEEASVTPAQLEQLRRMVRDLEAREEMQNMEQSDEATGAPKNKRKSR